MPAFNLTNSTTYFRGHFVPFSQANVSIASSPFLYGLAIYTVFMGTWNADHGQVYLFRLREHYDRLVTSAKIMDFTPVSSYLSFEEFQHVITDLVRKNNVKEDVLVRAMIFVDELAAGTRVHGLKTDLAVYVYPMGEILPTAGAHVMVSSWTRTADNMIPSRAKVNGSYLNGTLMKNEALAAGYDDALSLDTAGHVAEGTVANFFMVRGGTLITPSTSTDILEGITRATILQVASDLHIPAIERSIDRSELYAADEAMFVGSSARVTPILSIDKRPVGTGAVGSVTKRISDQFHDMVTGLLAHNWLTPVYERPASE